MDFVPFHFQMRIMYRYQWQLTRSAYLLTCGQHKFKDFLALEYRDPPKENTQFFFKGHKWPKDCFRQNSQMWRDWLNYRIDTAYGKCCSLRKKMQTMAMEPGTNQGTIWRMNMHLDWWSEPGPGDYCREITEIISRVWEEWRWQPGSRDSGRNCTNTCIRRELLARWSPSSELWPLRFSIPSATPRQEESAGPHWLPQSTDLTAPRQWCESECVVPAVPTNVFFSLTCLSKDFLNWDCLRVSSHFKLP